MNRHVLVVEDEQHLAQGLQANLEAEGYTVTVASDGQAALEQWAQADLIILDVMLPRLDGFSVCRAIRAAGGRTPILFLTVKDGVDERVQGLEAGGDDYLTKPFHLRELLLRVQGMFRRQAWYGALPDNGVLRLGGHYIDLRGYRVVTSLGEHQSLTQKEAMILKLLYERAGSVVRREEILDQVWGYNTFPSTRTVDNFIVRLRRLLEPDPTRPIYIHTVRGVGYRLTPQGEPETT